MEHVSDEWQIVSMFDGHKVVTQIYQRLASDKHQITFDIWYFLSERWNKSYFKDY